MAMSTDHPSLNSVYTNLSQARAAHDVDGMIGAFGPGLSGNSFWGGGGQRIPSRLGCPREAARERGIVGITGRTAAIECRRIGHIERGI